VKKISIIIFFYIVFSCFSLSQEIPKIDGEWWKAASNSFVHTNQVSFLAGFIDGIGLGADISLMNFNPDSICFKVGWASYMNETSILDTIRIMDIQDLMTAFYREDSLSLCIACHHVFWLSALKLSNADPEKINNLIELYRKEDCKAILNNEIKINKK
jgi:hypothetical protein